MDNKTLINRDDWAVTLASIGTSIGGSSMIGEMAGHALIYYEGLQKGIPFLRYCHYKKEVGFDSGELKHFDKSKIHAKTKTWRISKIAIEKMVQSGKANPKEISILGYNCLAAAIDLVNKELKIELPDPSGFKMPNHYISHLNKQALTN